MNFNHYNSNTKRREDVNTIDFNYYSLGFYQDKARIDGLSQSHQCVFMENLNFESTQKSFEKKKTGKQNKCFLSLKNLNVGVSLVIV